MDNLMGNPTHFYDNLADSYHLLFTDWSHAISWQGEFFDRLIRTHLPLQDSEEVNLLDASCGIGTQSLGLARYNYNVTATDLSPKAVERARSEANNLGLDIRFGVADFRTLESDVKGKYHVVLSADNAIPHLLTDGDLKLACENLYRKVELNGLLLITIRDYDELIRDKQQATIPRIMDDGKRISFQKWDWLEEGNRYIVNQFILQNKDGEWSTQVNKTYYRALLRQELSHFLQLAGFKQIEWLMPEETGVYQPIVKAVKLN